MIKSSMTSREKMNAAAQSMEFERAAEYRDLIIWNPSNQATELCKRSKPGMCSVTMDKLDVRSRYSLS